MYTTPGTYQWVVPEGVYSVSCVIIAGGGQGTIGYGSQGIGAGFGGGLRYRNNIPVTPGTSYTIIVGSGGVTQETTYNFSVTDTANHTTSVNGLGLTVGTYTTGTAFSADVKGGVGGFSNGTSGLNKTSSGGPAGTYTNGVDPGTYVTGQVGSGSGLYGSTGSCGGGGNATGPSQDVGWSPKYVRKGGDGGCRIIWGPNRAFPSTNVGDL
ncbi:hypothetical protein D3C75_716630 [compost metagenome]